MVLFWFSKSGFDDVVGGVCRLWESSGWGLAGLLLRLLPASMVAVSQHDVGLCGGGGFRGGCDGGRFGGGSGRGGRFGGGGGRGGYHDEGPPAEVVEVSAFVHGCEGDAVTKLTNEKIPYFNAPIYLQNKTQIGKVDEIFGPINESFFSVKMKEGIVATSYSPGDKFYIDPFKLLPLARFLPQPKGQAQAGGRGGGGRGGGRGFGRGGGGGGGFRGRSAPRGGRGGFRGGGRGGGGGFRGRGRS